jgi:hypothetical protein
LARMPENNNLRERERERERETERERERERGHVVHKSNRIRPNPVICFITLPHTVWLIAWSLSWTLSSWSLSSWSLSSSWSLCLTLSVSLAPVRQN